MPTATAELIRSEIEQANPSLARKPLPLPDPSEMPNVFANLGVTPIQSTFGEFDDSGKLTCCCALTAVYETRTTHGVRESPSGGVRFPTLVDEELGVTDGFMWGAVRGFDGDDPDLGGSPEHIAGYAWGKASWEACVSAGLTEDIASIDDDTA